VENLIGEYQQISVNSYTHTQSHTPQPPPVPHLLHDDQQWLQRLTLVTLGST
jgi:hypothetical protein